MAEAESTHAERAVNNRVSLSLPEDLSAVLVGITPASISVAPLPELGGVELDIRDKRDGAEPVRVVLHPGAAVNLAFRLAGAARRIGRAS